MEKTDLQKLVTDYVKGEISLENLLSENPNFGEIHKHLLHIYKNTKFVAKEKMYKNFIELEKYISESWDNYNRIITIYEYYKFKDFYKLKKNKIKPIKK